MILLVAGTFVGKTSFGEREKQIYRKYLGEDYDFNVKPTVMISNHVSWAECLNIYAFNGGFVGKKEMENVYVIGFILKISEGLFISRDNKESKNLVLDEIKERQNEYNKGERDTMIMIYPEGTICSGTHLLPFKKGAFMSCLPVKPYLNITYPESHCNLGQTNIHCLIHNLIFGCFAYNYFTFKELPTICCNNYLLKNCKQSPEEADSVTFMNNCRNIMMECGNFKSSDKTLKDCDNYTDQIEVLKRDKNCL
jgi:lysophosphatidylcholine acyltransferase/lyso-PAF acetyltransferase